MNNKRTSVKNVTIHPNDDISKRLFKVPCVLCMDERKSTPKHWKSLLSLYRYYCLDHSGVSSVRDVDLFNSYVAILYHSLEFGLTPDYREASLKSHAMIFSHTPMICNHSTSTKTFEVLS